MMVLIGMHCGTRTGRPKRMVVASMAAVLMIVAGAATVFDEGMTEVPDGADVELRYLDGSVGFLSDFRGKPVVLNFWASWCASCIAELPDFQAVSERFADEVVFIGVNVEETDRVAADALIAETGVTYRLADDPDGEIFQSFAGIGMPTTVFVDVDGAVVNVHSGVVFAEDLQTMMEQHLLR